MSKRYLSWILALSLAVCPHTIPTASAQATPNDILRFEYSTVSAWGWGERLITTIWTVDVTEGVLYERMVNTTHDMELCALRYAIPSQELEALTQSIAQSDFFSLPKHVETNVLDGVWDNLAVSKAAGEHAISGLCLDVLEPYGSILAALRQARAAARKADPLSCAVPREEPLRLSLLSQFFTYAWGIEMCVVVLDQYGDVRTADLGGLVTDQELNNLDDVLAYLGDSAHSEVIASISLDLLRALETAADALPEIGALQGERRAFDCGLLRRFKVRYDEDGGAHALELSVEGEVMARREEPEAMALCTWLNLYQPNEAFFSKEIRYWHDLEGIFGDVIYSEQ